MKTSLLLSATLLFLSGTPCTLLAQDTPAMTASDAFSFLLSGRLIDLTHAFDDSTVYWPTEEGFQLQQGSEGYTDKGYYYTANSFCAAEHGGTHLDAPVHFAEGRHTVEQIPLQQLMGRGIVIDVHRKVADDPDYQVTVSDILEWERQKGRIPDSAIVLLRTGFGSYWPDRLRYLGTAKRGQEAVAELHFPGLHPQAARWLTENRVVSAIGLDTPSIDYGQSQLFETHQVLFRENIPVFENVAHLELLPLQDFLVIALPMKIRGGSGAPLRIVALLP